MEMQNNTAAAGIAPSANNGAPACAACRHQRKKCSEKCVLAPFFPIEKTGDFQAVHKIFGVSNVTKLVKDMSREDGKRAAASLIWEASCRLKDPVLGPYGEYRRVLEELRVYKSYYHQILHHQPQLLTQGGGMVYNNNKSGQSLMVWNGNGNLNTKVIGNTNDVLDYTESNGSGIEDSHLYEYASLPLQNMERLKQERESGSVIMPQQQHPGNYFNRQFY